ncbi:MAG: phage minor capsid protein [Butyricicoccus porcorum]
MSRRKQWSRFLELLPYDVMIPLWTQVEQDVIADIARRISRYDYWIPAAEHQRHKLREMGLAQEYILKQLSTLTKRSQKELLQLMQTAAEEALTSDRRYYRSHGIETPDELSERLQQVLLSGYRNTNQLFRNLTSTTADAAQKQFINALDQAWMQVQSGAFSYETAISNAIKSVAKPGLKIKWSASGHQDTVEVAVRRAVMTGVNQTAADMRLQLAQELGCDLVEVTAHAGARPSHAEWQGRAYSISGKSTKYPSLRDVTGYGTGDGLCGWNCRHSFHPYVEGTAAAYTEDDLKQYSAKTITYNGKQVTEYDARQIQRYHERQIRRWKRESAAMEAGGQDSTVAASKVRQWQQKQADFVKQTGLKRQYAREQIA